MAAIPKKSVLLLDDSDDLLTLMKSFAERICDCHAVTVRSLREMERLEEDVLACEVAILDINLGPQEPNGIDVYKWLRLRGYKNKVYFLTGHAKNYPLVAEAEQLGGAEILSKPLPPATLAQVLRGDL